MEKRFTALRIIATLYKIVGVVIAILVVIGVIVTIISQPFSIDFGFGRLGGALGLISSIVLAVVEILAGGLSALGVYAIGELLYVLINIEENTRFTALIIRDRMQPAQPVQAIQPVPPTQSFAPPPMQPPSEPPVIQNPPPYNPPESQS
jgi:hypothetical protein